MRPLFSGAGLALLLVITVSGCDLLDPSPGGHGPPSVTPPSTNTTVSLDIGRRIFAEDCARCHGDSAQGTTVAPAIQGLSGVATIVRTGKGSMPPFASLSDADIQSLGLFLTAFGVATDTLTGAPLFAALCARCHGPNAEGIVGKGPGLALETGIAGVVHSGRGDMPSFPKLTDAQIASLERFLAAVPFERSGRNLYVRYCAVCHGDGARGVRGKGPGIRNNLEDLEEAIREGPGSMPAFPGLSPADVDSIRNYIGSL